jgi:hypothetical protein
VTDHGTVILGIPIPSTSRAFLTVLAVHVLGALACIVSGLVAMFSEKKFGRHVAAGSVYYWSLALVCASMALRSVMRWPEDIRSR